MKTKIQNLIAGAVLLAAVCLLPSPARANDHGGFMPSHVGAALHLAPSVFPGFARGWAPRPIRAVPLLPFATACPVACAAPCAPAYGYAAAPVLYYKEAPRPEPVITVTIPVSVARQLVASGAIKLP